MKSTLPLKLFVVTLVLLTGKIWSLDDNELWNLCSHIIAVLYRQARTNSGERQFAAMILLRQNQRVDDFCFLRESNGLVVDGADTDCDTNIFPPISDTLTYAVARPDGIVRSGRQNHSELALLDGLQTMWYNFLNRYGLPHAIILFTWLPPCRMPGYNCRQEIANRFSQEPYRSVPNRIVAYGRPASPNDQNDINNIMRTANVRVFFANSSHPLYTGSGRRRRQVTHPQSCSQVSFQRCLLECYRPSNLGCCTNDPDQASKQFIDQLVDALEPHLDNVNSMLGEADNWLKKNVCEDCLCLTYDNQFKTRIKSCLPECYSKPVKFYSKPFGRTRSACRGSWLDSPASDWPDSWCKSWKLRGVLCSRFKLNAITASNEMVSSSCERKGYGYSWAWTPNDWDYCCETECTDGTTCSAGDRQVYCGRTSYRTISNTRCRQDHPCGLHTYANFWCYTDNNYNWDYCCRPEHRCDKYGYRYTWCYTQIDGYGGWQYCTPDNS